MKKILTAIDFDHTIVIENSDVVVANLVKGELSKGVKDLNTKNGWIPYMQEIFRILHSQNITEDNIRNTLKTLKPVPDFINFFGFLKQINSDVIIVSDANTYFINTWLQYNNVDNAVDTVYSNPAQFDSSGLLILENYHDQNWCGDCSKNLCKGHILTNHIKTKEKETGVAYDMIVYIGDGRNDFCPAKKLTSKDVVFPKKDFPLEKKIRAAGKNEINAKHVIPWTTTDEIQTHLERLTENNPK